MLFVVGMAGAEARAVTSAASAVTVAEATNPTISPTDVVRNGPNSGPYVGSAMLPLKIVGATISTCNGSEFQITVENLPGSGPDDDIEINFTDVTTGLTYSATASTGFAGMFTFSTGWTPSMVNDGDVIQLNVSFQDPDGSGGGPLLLAVNPMTTILDIIPSPAGGISATTETVCSDVATTATVTALTAGDAYLITTPGATGVTGHTASQSGITAGSDIEPATLNNVTMAPVDVTYTITPYDFGPNNMDDAGLGDDCLPSPLVTYTYIVTVNPEPFMNPIDSDDPGGGLNPQVLCSDEALGIDLDFGVDPASVAAVSYNVTAGAMTGNATGSQTTGSGLLTGALAGDMFNDISGPDGSTFIYSVVPVSGAGCEGDAFDINVTINPQPILTAQADITVCSDVAIGVTYSTSNGVDISAGTMNGTANTILPASVPPAFPGSPSTASVNDEWHNVGATPEDVEYVVNVDPGTGCTSPDITYTVTVNPEPVFTNATAGPICPDATNSIDLSATHDGISVVATTYDYSTNPGAGLTLAAGPGTGTGVSNTGTQTDEWTGTNLNPAIDVTYTVTPISADGCEGETFEVTLAIEDVTPPDITCAANVTVNTNGNSMCEVAVPDVVTGSVATDDCQAMVTITQSPLSTAFNTGTAHNGTFIVTVTADDMYGNTTPCDVTVTVNDNDAPDIIECSADVTVTTDANCDYTLADYTAGTTTTDNCTTPTVTQLPIPGVYSASGDGTTQVVLTADDGNGNTSDCTMTVTIDDVTPPDITCAPDVTLNPDANCDVNVVDYTGAATATDNCDPSVSITQSPMGTQSALAIADGTAPVVLTADDGNGNTSACTVTVTIDDITPPVITCPSGTTVNTNGNASCEVDVPDFSSMSGLGFTDNCESTATFGSQAPTAGSAQTTGGHNSTFDVVLTISDGNGNDAMCTATVTVVDNDDPTITMCPADVTVSTTGNMDCEITIPDFSAGFTATDNCDAAVAFDSQSPVNGPYTGAEHDDDIPVTFVVVDDAGNTAACTVTVTVDDVNDPVITMTGMLASCYATVADAEAAAENATTATDNCDASLTITADAPMATGSIDITVTVTDDAGNTDTHVYTTCVNAGAPVASDPATPPGSNYDVYTCGTSLGTIAATPLSCTVAKTIAVPDWADECGTPTEGTPTAATTPGNVNVPLTFYGPNIIGADFPVGTTVVTFTATDNCGNVGTCNLSITVFDAENPTIGGCPSNMTVNSSANGTGDCTGYASWTAPGVSDNCPGVYRTAAATATGSSDAMTAAGTITDGITAYTLPVGVYTVTYTAHDGGGLTATCAFVVTVHDNEPAAVTCEAAATIVLNGNCELVVTDVTDGTTTTDNCNPPYSPVALVQSPTAGTALPSGEGTTHTIVVTATDPAGNTSSCSVILTGDDTTPPTPTCEGPATIVLDASCQLIVTNVMDGSSATDNCTSSGSISWTQSPAVGAALASGEGMTHTITVTANDNNGNTATCTVVLTGDDTSAPTATCEANAPVVLNANCELVVTNVVDGSSATDNCDMSVALSQSPAAGTALPSGEGNTHVITVTADDGNGNSSTCTVTLTGDDATAPTATCEAGATIVLNANCELIVTNVVDGSSATDNCDPSVTLTQSPVAGTALASGEGQTHNITVTADDGNGNSSYCTVVLTGDDTTAPTATCEADATVVLNANCELVVTNVVDGSTATDNCDMSVALTQSPAAGTALASGEGNTHVITVTADDGNGNSSTCTVTLTGDDTSAPTATCEAAATIVLNGNCELIVTDVTDGTTATDNCTSSGSITLTQSPLAGSALPSGEGNQHTITVTANDGNGNTSLCTVVLTGDDQSAPTVTCEADATVVLNGNCELVVTNVVDGSSATDNCDPSVTLTQSPAMGTALASGEGTTHVITVTADDGNGNSSTCTVTLTGDDTSAPTATCEAGATIVLNANCELIVTDVVDGSSATDNCDMSVALTQSPAAGTALASGEGNTHVITVTADDGNGNSSTCTVTLTGDDQSAPTATCEAGATVALNGNCELVVTNVVDGSSATDNCDMSVALTQFPTAGTALASGEGNTHVITVTADDGNGNSSTCTVTLTGDDQSAPTATCEAGATIVLNANCELIVTNVVDGSTATDNCDMSVALSQDIAAGTALASGEGTTHVITVTADDGNGNSSTCTVTLTGDDQSAPTATCEAGATVALNANCELVVTNVVDGSSATDNCTTATLTQSPLAGTALASGEGTTHVITVTADDGNGNSSTCTVTLTGDDQSAPTATCEAGATIALNASCQLIVTNVVDGTTATDNCDMSVALSQDIAVGTALASGEGQTHVITVTADDGNGNSSTCTVTLTGDDVTAPAVTCEAAQNVVLNASCQVIVPDLTDGATGTDACGTVTFTQSPAIGAALASAHNMTHVITVTGNDGNGNTASCTVTLTGKDQTAPVPAPNNLGFPDIDNWSCGLVLPPVTATPSACINTMTISKPLFNDNCAATVTITQTATAVVPIVPYPSTMNVAVPVSNFGNFVSVNFPVGTTTLVFKGTDAGGNTATCGMTVTVTDDEDPELGACPPNQTVSNTTNQCYAALVSWTPPTASDNCTGVGLSASATSTSNAASTAFAATITGASSIYMNMPVGVYTITYLATDLGLNTDACTFTVTVADTQAPSFTFCPSNVVVNSSAIPGNCTGEATWAAATASDNCTSVTITSSHTSGSAFPVGVTNVVITATDAASNTATCGFTVTVNDNEAPTANCPADIMQSVDLGQCYATVTFAHNATDNCSATTVASPASGSQFLVGTSTVVVTATDGAGNTGTCSFTVTVNETEAPVAICPANITTTNDAGLCSDVVTFTPSATDNCLVASVVATPASGSIFVVGTTTVTVVATDGAGNTDDCTFTVTVNDTEAPVAICPSNITTTNDAGLCSDVVMFTPSATDNCSVSTVVASPASGSAFAVGTTTVTVVATDIYGNTDDCTFTVTVNDTEAPVANCPAPITQNNDAGLCSAVVTFAPTANDNCGVASVVSSPASGSTFAVGTTTVTVVATDIHGNTDDCTFTVTVNDNEVPTITCPANVTYGECAIGSINTPTTGDNCGVASVTNNAPMSFPNGTTIVTWTVTDIHGNTNSCQQTVIIVPTPVGANQHFGVCTAETTNLNLQSFITSNTPSNTFTWTVNEPTGFVIGEAAGSGPTIAQTLSVTIPLANSLPVTYTVTPTSVPFGCVGTPFTVVVDVNPVPVAQVLPNGDFSLCGNESRILLSNVTGVLPMTYAWSIQGTTGTATATLTGISTPNPTLTATGGSGTVTVQVFLTDADGCSSTTPATLTFTISQNPAANAISGNNAPCPNSILPYSVTNNGGNTYAWTLGSGGTITTAPTNASINVQWVNVPGGPHTLTLVETNAAGCSTTNTFAVTIQTNSGTEVCNGIDDDCDGSIDEGVLLAYYEDDDMDGYGDPLSTPILSCTAPMGNYVANNTDCNDANNAINPAATEVCNNMVDEDCDSQIGGNISATFTPYFDCEIGTLNQMNIAATGGAGALTYSMSGTASATQPTGLFINLAAGPYTFAVTDAEGCSVNQSVTYQTAIALTSMVTQQVSCNGGSNGASSMTFVSGGTGPFTYEFKRSGVVVTPATPIVYGQTVTNTGLTAGNYRYFITDLTTGCVQQGTLVAVTQPLKVNAMVTKSSPLCNGESNGSVTGSATGGTAPYSYLWNTGATTQTVNGLPAGNYTVTVTDVNGCTDVQASVLSQPAVLNVNFVKTNVTCGGGNNGSITVNPSGGTGTKTYSWSNGMTTQTISSLTAGTYTVTVMDANGCTKVGTTSLTEPATLTVTIASTNPNCFGEASGSVTANPVGGTGTKTYAWSFGSNTKTNSGLVGAPGGVSYTVTVTDANGCTAVSTAVLTDPPAIVINSITSAPGSPGKHNVTVNASGGTPSLKYSRNGVTFQVSNVFSNLNPGTYTFTVRDAKNCTVSQTVAIPTMMLVGNPTTDGEANEEVADRTEEAFSLAFDLVPNPATTDVRIMFDGKTPENAMFDVQDASGKLLFTKSVRELVNNGNRLSLDQLSTGVVFVTMRTEGMNPVTKRLVVLKD